MDDRHRGLAAHLDTSAYEAAVELDWADLRVGLTRRRRLRTARRAALSVGAAALVAVLALVWGATCVPRPGPQSGREQSVAAAPSSELAPARPSPVEPVNEGPVERSPAEPGPTVAAAPKQTAVVPGEAARLRECDGSDGRPCLELQAGGVELALAHGDGVELHVGELRFVSEREASFRVVRGVEVVRLEVIIGSVRIERPDHGAVTIVAHEQWSTEIEAPKYAAPETAASEAEDPADESVPAAASPSRLPATAEPEPTGAADQAWAETLEARRSGDPERAFAALAAFYTDHPRDPRVGIALFEAARIRMDKLDDLPGATKLLKRALARGSSTSYHRDALVRLVEAYELAGDRDGCVRERERFLARYPSGAHHATVAGACR